MKRMRNVPNRVDRRVSVMNRGDDDHGSDSSLPLVDQRTVQMQFKEKHTTINTAIVSPSQFLSPAVLLQVVQSVDTYSFQCSKRK